MADRGRGTPPRRPMLATRGDHVPTGPDWAHEVKWDGIRALVDVAGGEVRVWTRTQRDVSTAFPELDDLASVGDDLLLDGEIVRLGDGVPTLAGLADRIHLTNAARARAMAKAQPVTLLAFDLLRAGGRELDGLPWRERREALEGLALDDVSWQVPATYDDGPVLLDAAREQGLEGIVSKRTDARYAWATRSRSWLKFPIRPTTSFVVGGWRPETGSTSRIGAVLVGEPTAEGLSYRGRVGSGLTGRTAATLAGLLEPLARPDSPFLDVPRVDAAGSSWVEPVLVVDVEYLRLTTDGRLRQPSYRGVRGDLTAADLQL